MAKPTLKKTTESKAPAATKATTGRAGAKLVKKTPAELRELIGEDTKIGVSVKELVAFATKDAKAAATQALLG